MPAPLDPAFIAGIAAGGTATVAAVGRLRRGPSAHTPGFRRRTTTHPVARALRAKLPAVAKALGYAGPKVVVTLPSGIDWQGGRDESGPLNAWLASLGDNWVLALEAAINVRLDKPLKITDRRGYGIKAVVGAKFSRLPGLVGTEGSQLFLEGGGDCFVTNLEIEGGNPEQQAGVEFKRENHHALILSGVVNACITNCNLHHCWADGIYLDARKVGPAGRPESYFWCDGIWVVDTYIHDTGRQGVTFQGVRNSVLVRCDVERIKRTSLEFEPKWTAYNYADNILITECHFGYGRLNLLTRSGSGPVHRIRYVNNRHARSLAIYVHDGGMLDANPPRPRTRMIGWEISGNLPLTAAEARPGRVQALPTPTHAGNPMGCCVNLDQVDGLVAVGNEQDLDDYRNPAMVVFGLTDCQAFDVRETKGRYIKGNTGLPTGTPLVAVRADALSYPVEGRAP